MVQQNYVTWLYMVFVFLNFYKRKIRNAIYVYNYIYDLFSFVYDFAGWFPCLLDIRPLHFTKLPNYSLSSKSLHNLFLNGQKLSLFFHALSPSPSEGYSAYNPRAVLILYYLWFLQRSLVLSLPRPWPLNPHTSISIIRSLSVKRLCFCFTQFGFWKKIIKERKKNVEEAWEEEQQWESEREEEQVLDHSECCWKRRTNKVCGEWGRFGFWGHWHCSQNICPWRKASSSWFRCQRFPSLLRQCRIWW